MAEDAGTGNRRAGLSEAKRRLLEERLRGRRQPAQGIPRRPDGASVPATPYQSAIWFLDRLVDDAAAYNLHAALEIRGSLDVEALSAAWAAVVGRHAGLRLLIRPGAETLHLDFDAVTAIPLEHVAVTDSDAGAVLAAAAAFAGRPFEMETGPLCRAALFTRGPRTHLLVIAVHHSVCDEQSVEIVLRDLLNAYQGRLADDPSARPADFGDYAHGLPRQLAAARDRDLDYWRSVLDGLPGQLELPADRPRGTRASYRGALHARRCPGLLSSVKTGASGHPRDDLYAAGLAACLLTLARYCGADDLAVGSPVSLRDSAALTDTVGMFVNPVVLRAPPAGRVPVADYVAAVRRRVNDALAHRNLPFETLVSELAPRRDAAHNPFFQVMFVLETRPELPDVPGLDITFRRLDTGTSKLDLTVFLSRAGEDAELSIEYNTALFDASTIAVLTDAYARVLGQIVAEPGRLLPDLALAAENDSGAPEPARLEGPCIDVSGQPLVPEAMARAAAGSPSTAAVIGCNGTLSYAELDRIADQLAAALVARDAGPNVPVALLMAPGPAMVAAIVGVLRAGAAYVPLDPGWPGKRLVEVLSDLAAAAGRDRALVVAQESSKEIAEAAGHHVMVFPDSGLATADPPDRHGRKPAPDDLAYVIFTSGSSGRPKGVAVEHGHLRHSNLARIAYYGESPRTFLLLSPLHFDSSVAGLFWTLATGGTLVLPRPEERADPRHIARLIESASVTHTLLLPSLYRLLLQAVDPSRLTTLRTVIVAGESCPQSLVALHRDRLPSVELVNEYGPTEATVWASAWRAGADADPVSLGRPVANTILAVRDAEGQPLPQGACGELWIGGGGVARGYLGDEPLTGERFTAMPGTPATRMYRTGDRVRRRPDGTLAYLGRLDNQLKIRGHRVEPEAIEDRLRGLPGVSDAVVVADAGGERLVAWCTAPGAEPPAGRELRQSLAAHLPPSAIPDRYEFIATLPRTGTGKLDRVALAARTRASATARAGDRAPDASPDDDVNDDLREIWRRLLQTDRVAADDDFFDAGGHSLLGVRLLLEIESRLGRSLPLAALFESPTLGALSARLDAPLEARSTSVSPVRTGGSLTPLFCVHGAIRRVAPHLHPDRPVFLIYRDLDTEAFAGLTVEDLAADYLRELRAVQHHGPYHLCGFSFGGQIAYEMARQLEAAGESVGLLGLLDPPPVTEDGYLGTLLQRKRAQLREVKGLPGKARFVFAEIAGGAARALVRQRRYLAARLRERRGGTMATGEIQERDRRNYIRASRAYAYPEYAGGAVLVLPDRVESVRTATEAGFAERIRGPFTVRVAQGAPAHEDMMKEPHCRWLGDLLEAAMSDGDPPKPGDGQT